MNKLDSLANEIQNLNTNTRKALAAKVLNNQANRLTNSFIPLDEDHDRYVKQARTDRAFKAIALGAIATSVACATAYVALKVNQKIEEQAEKERIREQEEKKAMIQKLSRIKGRV
ncbi:hypothetical protein [Allobaculum stercoricanis]|uniref:hypothetical protein n=1 Tax=Allobaculum stercoricanis TaxID=174709 RepID=UPI0023F319F7|nr:hypothetical protein [Allobaculum stercoricanis]